MAVLTFLYVLVQAAFYSPSSEINLPDSIKKSLGGSVKEKILVSYPKRLRIPGINLNAKVQYVGITKNGNMATPNNFTDVGWFKYGTIPGDQGSAVLAGHVDNGLAFPAVFAHLRELEIGDSVYVDTNGGHTIHFIVTDLRTYPYNARTEEIFSANGAKLLRLITCAGNWIETYKTHDQRLVVTALEQPF